MRIGIELAIRIGENHLSQEQSFAQNRWAHEYPSEGSDSNVDGIITLGGVEL